MAIFNVREKARGAEDAQKHAELEAAQAAEAAKVAAAAVEEARRQTEQARRERDREYKRRERELAGEVAQLEERVVALLRLAPAPGRVPHDLRVSARTWLHSTDSDGAADVFADEVAGPLHAGGSQCSRLLGFVEADLGFDHPLAGKVDGLEVQAWDAFTRRVRVLAGEEAS